MEIFRFIAWWWKQTEATVRALLAVFSFFFLMVTMGVVFGTKGILLLLSAILSILVLALVYVLIRLVHQRYGQYKKYRDEEADKIIQRLRG